MKLRNWQVRRPGMVRAAAEVRSRFVVEGDLVIITRVTMANPELVYKGEQEQ